MVTVSLSIHDDDAQGQELVVCLPGIPLTTTLLTNIQSLLASVGDTANAKFIEGLILPSSYSVSSSLPCMTAVEVATSCSCDPDRPHLKFVAGKFGPPAAPKRRRKGAAPSPISPAHRLSPSQKPLKNSAVKVSLLLGHIEIPISGCLCYVWKTGLQSWHLEAHARGAPRKTQLLPL